MSALETLVSEQGFRLREVEQALSCARDELAAERHAHALLVRYLRDYHPDVLEAHHANLGADIGREGER